ncbi:hypothetical protein MMC20_004525 [Loxospora ochrophaea]|nr:hypothetical protein [Loxospora ochrophaea]
MARSLENITVSVPNGTTNHGNPNLLCTPSKWTDIAVFFLANFFAHVATVKSLPGEPALHTLVALLMALMFPTSGVNRGVFAAHQRAVFSDTPLETAARAGALCVVVRSQWWRPCSGDKIENVKFLIAKEHEKPRHTNGQNLPGTRVRQYELDEDMTGRRMPSLLSILRSMSDLRFSGFDEVFEVVDVKKTSDFFKQTPTPGRSPQCQLAEPPVLHVDNHGGFRDFSPSTKILSYKGRKVHGVCALPQGYALQILPFGAQIKATCQRQQAALPSEKNSWRKRLGLQWNKSEFDTSSNVNSIIRHGVARVSDEISSSYSFSKGLVAIFQTLYASFTLYQTRGDQLQRYGYAAFGLTVAPYLVMSIVNLTSTVLTPDYSTVYLVQSPVMEEAIKRGGFFEGVVGSTDVEVPASDAGKLSASFEVDGNGRTLAQVHQIHHDMSSTMSRDCEQNIAEWTLEVAFCRYPQKGFLNKPPKCSLVIPSGPAIKTRKRIVLTPFFLLYEGILVGSIAIAIVGGLSHFKAGYSTTAQRVWTMTWLATGIMGGQWTMLNGLGASVSLSKDLRWACFYFAPAIGGFVVVAQMLKDYGNCVQI